MIDFRWRFSFVSLALARLSKAAATLAMPQSMVSRAVSHLEPQCGERLIVRLAARHRRAQPHTVEVPGLAGRLQR